MWSALQFTSYPFLCISVLNYNKIIYQLIGFLTFTIFFIKKIFLEDEEPVNNSRQGGVRLIPRILQVFRNFSNRRDDSDDAASQGDPRAATEDQDENFDRQLPGQHLYLGTLGEVHGRTFFDDNEE